MRHLERLLFIPGGASAQSRSGFNRTMLSRPRSSSLTTRTMTSGGREGWTSGRGLSFRVHRQCQVENGWKRQPFSNSAGASTGDLLSPGRLGVGRSRRSHASWGDHSQLFLLLRLSVVEAVWRQERGLGRVVLGGAQPRAQPPSERHTP
jgi:hypothetical protein